MTAKNWIISGIRDYSISVAGGFLIGALVGVWSSSFVRQFLYHEGWYGRYAPFLLIPLVVFLFSAARLFASTSTSAFSLAAKWMLPTAVVYIGARYILPMANEFAWIEFTAFWIFLAQLCALLVVAAWRTFWEAHARIKAAR